MHNFYRLILAGMVEICWCEAFATLTVALCLTRFFSSYTLIRMFQKIKEKRIVPIIDICNFMFKHS